MWVALACWLGLLRGQFDGVLACVSRSRAATDALTLIGQPMTVSKQTLSEVPD